MPDRGYNWESGKDEESSAEAASGNYGDKTIGFVGMTLNNEYHITLANGAKVEAEAKGSRLRSRPETSMPALMRSLALLRI